MKYFLFFKNFIAQFFTLSLFCALFLNTAFAQSSSQISPQVQKLAQTPKDTPIKITTQDNYTLCYIPTFSAGSAYGSYIGILNCADSNARSARYDVFGRLAYNINDTWLCITAPDSVAVQRRGKDYLYLSPCVINLKSQQWKIKEGVFYSSDESYSIKDDGSFLYAVNRLEGGLYTHKLHPSMQEWAKTIATPGNLSLVTAISWTLTHKDGQERYFLTNNQSLKNTTPLYYNVTSGHIATYDSLSGTLSCMYSNTGKQQWDWITWGLCTDAKPPKNNRAFFKPVPLDDKHYAFLDQDGNVLRVTRYGIHWGVPYSANKEYIKTDTANSPTSNFETDAAMREWMRFIYANIGKNLHNCPAPGYSTQQNKALLSFAEPTNEQNQSSLNPPLPRDFVLSEAWVRRLYDIGTTADGSLDSSGICGICLLHTYQMIAELLENPYQPRSQGGYFFDTYRGRSPFESFRARNRLLHDTLADIFTYYEQIPVADIFAAFRREGDRAIASSISMLPQYNWSILGDGYNVRDMTDVMQAMLDRPVGSVFFMAVWARNPHTNRLSGHAVPALRLNEGVVIMPTNTRFSTLDSYRSRLIPVQNTAGILERITRYGGSYLRLTSLRVFEISSVHHNAFEELISLSNCTGDGEDRRGNALIPLPELLNQCISGRCEW